MTYCVAWWLVMSRDGDFTDGITRGRQLFWQRHFMIFVFCNRDGSAKLINIHSLVGIPLSYLYTAWHLVPLKHYKRWLVKIPVFNVYIAHLSSATNLLELLVVFPPHSIPVVHFSEQLPFSTVPFQNLYAFYFKIRHHTVTQSNLWSQECSLCTTTYTKHWYSQSDRHIAPNTALRFIYSLSCWLARWGRRGSTVRNSNKILQALGSIRCIQVGYDKVSCRSLDHVFITYCTFEEKLGISANEHEIHYWSKNNQTTARNHL